MSLRRLHNEQPEGFAFTSANQEWAERQMEKYPEGRQASAVIPLLWRAQEQEGWVSRPVIEAVAKMLGMSEIRVLEVATFYFMFHLHPVGSLAHVQVCGTTSCMICGAEELIAVCKNRIADRPHALSADGRFSWEEVECLGACSNAPMVQIGKDYYEDLTPESFAAILDAFARGEIPTPGPQAGRFASEPATGLTSLIGEGAKAERNASIALALAHGDTIARIDGERPAAAHRDAVQEDDEVVAGPRAALEDAQVGRRPPALDAPREDGPDDLKRMTGVGPKLEKLLNEHGIHHFDQIAEWGERELDWADALEGVRGRARRDDWVGQARALREDGGGEA